ncbi:hypothetical protein K492DRAFT_203148, partial [Lichtheimia hyalospora FSU 10163]
MSPVESAITQVSSTTQPTLPSTQSEEEHSGTSSDDERQQGLPPVLTLELRGEPIQISRETLVSFPESVLIAMFPNGLVLNGQEQAQVDFDPACVRMMLDFFVQARATHAEHFSEEAYLADTALDNRNIASAPQHHPLYTKPVVIVLREELDYYILPAQQHTKTSTNIMASLKTAGGHYLQQQNQVFGALLRNISKENNMAEQHLVDILCKAGFTLEDTWNYRALEPKRTCVSSLSLVHLKTSGPQRRMATAQKLMMFYGKPARKCWWDHTCVELMDMQVRLWARRTWTLELALV